MCGALLASACSSFAADVKEADRHTCAEIIESHARFVGDARYAELRSDERQQHEAEVATCYLDLRRPEQALKLAEAWPQDSVARSRVKARVAAQLAREDECRLELERVMAFSDDLEFWLDTPEFAPLAAKDWFLRQAINVWSKTREEDLETFMTRLARLSRLGLLPLRVATADVHRSAGSLVVWTGAVRESRLDRANSRTLLFAEGLDSSEQLVGINTRPRRINPENGTVEYDEKRIYESRHVANGLGFVVQYPGISERLVTLTEVTIIGRFVGRDRDRDVPIVQAFVIMQPETLERTDHDR